MAVRDAQEYRTLHGLPRPSSVLVDGSDIGTDPLFYSAGVLTEVEKVSTVE